MPGLVRSSPQCGGSSLAKVIKLSVVRLYFSFRSVSVHLASLFLGLLCKLWYSSFHLCCKMCYATEIHVKKYFFAFPCPPLCDRVHGDTVTGTSKFNIQDPLSVLGVHFHLLLSLNRNDCLGN